MENELLTELEQKIGYQFKDKGLLKHAMSHSSYANERHMGKLKSNERLEFLVRASCRLLLGISEYRILCTYIPLWNTAAVETTGRDVS